MFMVKWIEVREGQVRQGIVRLGMVWIHLYANMADVVNAWCGGLIAWLVQVRYGMDSCLCDEVSAKMRYGDVKFGLV